MVKSTAETYIVKYPGTGYEFHIVRCRTEAELREHFRFRGMPSIGAEGEALNGYTHTWGSFGLVHEVHVAVVETGDEREDVRRWAHEIQHAAEQVGGSLDMTLVEEARRREELPALSAELLADAVLLMFRGLLPGTRPESGFPNAFNGTQEDEDGKSQSRRPAGAEAAPGVA